MAIKMHFPELYTNPFSKKCDAIPITEQTTTSKNRITRNWRTDAIRKKPQKVKEHYGRSRG
jgi:hypothetical protein